jgi:outer membrane protein assembly factor BamD
MLSRVLLIFCLTFCLFSCSKKEAIYTPSEENNPYNLYQKGLDAFQKNDFFYASKKFSEAEINFDIPELAAKSSIMASFSLYGINFYRDAIDNLERYLKTYPADKNNIYAHYLMAIIFFEQISDEKKDLKPLIRADKKIKFFLRKYPNSEYAMDLRFKQDLIQNQLAAKELYVAKFYISVQKWIPAINRLKIIMEKYDKTIFIEEALHRLVEIHYYLGLENEAKKYVKILGYNYNSGEWFSQSYKILNKNYKIEKITIKKEKSLLKKIFNIFK